MSMSSIFSRITPPLGSLLAQFQDPPAPNAGKMESEVMKWGGILIVLIIVGGGAIMMFRRKLRDAAASSGADAGFSLSDLRAMRDRGEITPEEYEQTRARVIAKVKGKPVPQKDGPPPAAIESHEALEQSPPEIPPPQDSAPDESQPGENPPNSPA